MDRDRSSVILLTYSLIRFVHILGLCKLKFHVVIWGWNFIKWKIEIFCKNLQNIVKCRVCKKQKEWPYLDVSILLVVFALSRQYSCERKTQQKYYQINTIKPEFGTFFQWRVKNGLKSAPHEEYVFSAPASRLQAHIETKKKVTHR